MESTPDSGGDSETASNFPIKLTFPHIDRVEDLDEVQRSKLKEKLHLETEQIILNFFTLCNKFFFSLKAQLRAEKVSIEDLVGCLEALRALSTVITSTYSKQPTLKDIVGNINNIEDVKTVIENHSSFYDYSFVEYMINTIGTLEDIAELEKYIEKFKEYAERRVYKCPSNIQVNATSSPQETKLYVKLDSFYDEHKLRELKRFQLKLASLLNVSYEVLRLCSIEKGCFKLVLIIPTLVKDIIFPLSPQQETELRELKVRQLLCGDYHFENNTQSNKVTL